ncbi:Multicopper oxidase aurL2 [Dirofilaria immitis]
MKISDEHVNIDGFDDQINSQQLLNQKEKFLRNYDLLRMANDNPMLRASLLLLTVVMIIFTITKICKLTYQIQYRCHRKHKTSKFFDEIPQVSVHTHSTDYPFFANKKRNQKKHKLARISRTWKAKSNLSSNSLPSKETKANISLTTESDSKQTKSEKIYPMLKSNLEASKSTELKD